MKQFFFRFKAATWYWQQR